MNIYFKSRSAKQTVRWAKQWNHPGNTFSTYILPPRIPAAMARPTYLLLLANSVRAWSIFSDQLRSFMAQCNTQECKLRRHQSSSLASAHVSWALLEKAELNRSINNHEGGQMPSRVQRSPMPHKPPRDADFFREPVDSISRSTPLRRQQSNSARRA